MQYKRPTYTLHPHPLQMQLPAPPRRMPTDPTNSRAQENDKIRRNKAKMTIGGRKNATLGKAILFAFVVAIRVPGIVISCLARRLWRSSEYSLKSDLTLSFVRR
jgi:hypothetical protein